MRVWLHQLLLSDPTLAVMLPGGVLASQNPALTQTPKQRPFLIHRFSTQRPELTDGGVIVSRSSLVWINIHDDPGDYMQIDDAHEQVKTLLLTAQGSNSPTDPSYGLIQCRWEEESEDLYDPDKGTIFRQGRYRIVHV